VEPASTWTIGRLLRWAADYLQSRDFAPARLEAELLLAKALNQDRLQLYLHFEQPLSRDELTAFKKLLKRRLNREPVAYITGRKGFWSLDLEIGPGALIPRPETETLVEAALARLPADSQAQVADLGTGCGPVLLALAVERPGLGLTGTDLSAQALAWARTNAQRLGLDQRVELVQGDLLTPLAGRRLGMIVMNPPYVTQEEFKTLAPDITAYEPALALVAGPEGLEIIRRLVEEAPAHLEPGGWLVFEIGSGQGRAAARLLTEANYAEVEILPDLAGHDRVAAARLKD